ncbi:hypothetical protein MRI28_04565 [Nocardiopsis dassonvillei]|uniref:hypothetical protein n=1 Tax=Nocardiopsis dassonvillei TaxID=2014 RepID=UPI00200F2851|nr:hypothetical protein [Nocardiopsis dassonvillei]MCK9868929.1 hypothetical protein [Nocardiopsis dassonvillei]
MRADSIRLDLTAAPFTEVRPKITPPFTPLQPRPRRRYRDETPRPRSVRRARPLPKPGGVR